MMPADPATFVRATDASHGVDAPLALALADVLVALTASLGDLAYDLGSDSDTLRRHMTSLQAVDHITQSQLAIADILRSSAPMTDRIAAVTLEGLAERLRAGYDDHADCTEIASVL